MRSTGSSTQGPGRHRERKKMKFFGIFFCLKRKKIKTKKLTGKKRENRNIKDQKIKLENQENKK